MNRYASIVEAIVLTAAWQACAQSVQTIQSAHLRAVPRAYPLALSGEIGGTHDPSIAVDHGRYYVFATGAAYPPHRADEPQGPLPADAPRPAPIGQLPIRCSADLHQWTRCGAVFPAVPAWIKEMSPLTKDLWAPDISFFDGVYHLYYSFSIFGKNTSGIALATNTTLDAASPNYAWVDRGLVLRSTTQDDFNAIDPNMILDDNGEAWLAFGSFWTGIKMRHLDRKSGLLSATDTKVYSLAARAHSKSPGAPRPASETLAGVLPNSAASTLDLPPDTQAIEAPFIVHHGDFYYLFVSWDLCCRGTKSTYRTMVGRSASVTGPYIDRDGKPMLDGGGTPLLAANATWLGPGGESLLQLPAREVIVFHAYNATDGRPSLHISNIIWNDGWPSAALDGEPKP